jgi:hypothetical protein
MVGDAVDAHDLVAVEQRGVREVTADEPGGTGDDYAQFDVFLTVVR